MVTHGATTIWELWNGDTANPAMNSGNHLMLVGDLITWFYQNLAGIRTDLAHPAFKHIIMRPTPVGDLTYVKASYNSSYGKIVSDWKIAEGRFIWNVTVPPNTTATVYVPGEGPGGSYRRRQTGQRGARRQVPAHRGGSGGLRNWFGKLCVRVGDGAHI